MNRIAAKPSRHLELAACLTSRWRANGHICVDLPHVAGRALEETGPEPLPALSAWTSALRSSGVVGFPGDFMPMILDRKNRLYLYRYWKYEQSLAAGILDRLGRTALEVDFGLLDAGLARLFASDSERKDMQREAARTAVCERFCVISGGPGTGKTRTVVRILALLIEQGVSRIVLCAPTGKAAARLKESIARCKPDFPESTHARIPADVTTIHRLLGARPDSSILRRSVENPLDAEVVIVDEASMVDVPLMAKLFDAVKPGARIILVGDRNQLASVEAGCALGDICSREDRRGESARIARNLVELRRNYRFSQDSGIARLSEAVRAGDADAALEILRSRSYGDLVWKTLPKPAALETELRKRVSKNGMSRIELFVETSLSQLGRHQILCAVHDGPYGRANINAVVERLLGSAGSIDLSQRWYSGRPIMILRNDANLDLYNGDLGLVLPVSSSNEGVRVFFTVNDEVRGFAPSRLPRHETAFAMTVHKSQGSEFEHVLLILPGRDSFLLTRELIYTGISRARGKAELWASEPVLRSAICRRVNRSSGLRDALWENE
jgi:exodeoxyribonuclease V alpha subunit